MIKTERYVRKPLYVDAVQVTEENFAEIINWCQGDAYKLVSDEPLRKGETVKPAQLYIRVRVHTPKTPRQTRAFIGDWILYTDSGYKIYNPKSFANTFDKVREEVKT